jgi:hypothetical protein
MLVTGVMDIEQSLEARRKALINRRLTQLPVAMPPPQEWRRASVRNMTENSRCLAVAGGRWENLIPEWNDLVFGFWQRAAIGCTARTTSETLCPAPREDACVLSSTPIRSRSRT